MMKMRKSRVSLALSAALAGGAIVAVPQQAAAQNVADSGIGQVLIFPYYSINDGWQSLFNVTNTSDLAIAVKVRFHEAQNSRDVLDFNVLLSPKDAWTGYVQRDAEGRPKLKTTDNSCTSPIIPEAGLELSNLAYTGPYDDGGIQEEERLWEGYVEMIAMGQCATTDSCFLPPPVTGTASDAGIGWLTEHVQGTPRDCATADSFFIAGTGAVGEDLSVVPGTGEPIANADSADSAGRGYVALLPDTEPLKGNLSIVQLAQGFGAGTEALAISGWAGTNNLVTAQQFPWFLEPTIATGENVWDTTGLPDIELLFNAESVINEWSANPNLGVKTDWVVSFPTKGYHVDQFCGQVQANNNQWRYDGAVSGGAPLGCSAVLIGGTTYEVYTEAAVSPYERITPPVKAPFENLWNDFDETTINNSPVTVTYTVYDREEGSAEVITDGTTPSPAPPPQVSVDTLIYESNVLAIGQDESALGSPIAGVLDAPDLLESKAEFGWLELAFSGPSGALPAGGFIMKTRDFGDPNKNYGQMMKHGYTGRTVIAP